MPDDRLAPDLRRVHSSLMRLERRLEEQSRRLAALEAGQTAILKLLADMSIRSIQRERFEHIERRLETL